MKKDLNYSLIVCVLGTLCFWLTVVFLSFLLSSCSLQGQRHERFDPNGIRTLNAEWWSMRCLWMSNGVECYTKTPYYTSGASVDNSASDANSVGAVAEGVVSGMKGL